MVDRVKPNEERVSPCGKVTLLYPIEFNFSSKLSTFNQWKLQLARTGKMSSQELRKWFLRDLFECETWQVWKQKHKFTSKEIDDFIKRKLKEELGLSPSTISEEIKKKMEKDLSKK